MGRASDDDAARAWLRPSPLLASQQPQPKQQSRPAPHGKQQQQHGAAVTRGLTNTMARPGEFQGMLTAVVHRHRRTGYLDPQDPANRSDKHNGGEFRWMESTSAKAFASIDERPIQFREDGLPISARRVPGKPLMAPKLPSSADRCSAKRVAARQRAGSIKLGGRWAQPHFFASVTALVHATPHRTLGQPNAGIAAEEAARKRKALGLL